MHILEDSRRYVLVGAGYGKSESVKPHWLFGNWGYERRSSEKALVCVCDADGQLYWVESDDIIVESIDGERPSEALRAHADRSRLAVNESQAGSR